MLSSAQIEEIKFLNEITKNVDEIYELYPSDYESAIIELSEKIQGFIFDYVMSQSDEYKKEFCKE